MNFLELTYNFCSGNTKFIFQIAFVVIRVLQIAVPFALIIWGSLDFFKAVIAGDEKEMKQKRKPFIQRLIAAIIVLLLPVIVNMVMKTLATNANNQFAECWNAVRGDSSNVIDIPAANGTDAWNSDSSGNGTGTDQTKNNNNIRR